MLTWSLGFLVVALLCGYLAFKVVVGTFARIVKLLFLVFLALAVVTLFF